jgi:hypothetical protein
MKHDTQQDIQLNDIQHNDTQRNDIQHSGIICDTQHKRLSAYIVIVLSVIMPNVVFLLIC